MASAKVDKNLCPRLDVVVQLYHMQTYIARIFHNRSRFYALFALIVLFAALYLNTNHFTLWGPWSLPLSDFEKDIPFLPSAIYVYMTAFLLLPLAVFFIGRKDLGRTMAGLIGIMFVCGLFFLLLPIAYPRPELLPAGTGWLTRTIYHFFTIIDTPQNCIPSQHAAVCLFVALALFHRHKALGIFFTLWTIAILISALTLKQHYLIDLAAGAALGIIFYLASFNKKRQYDA